MIGCVIFPPAFGRTGAARDDCARDCFRPTFLLCDEPTGDLDRKSADEIMELFSLVKEYKKTALMVTHDPVVAARADMTLHLEKGVLVEAGRLQTVSGGGVR